VAGRPVAFMCYARFDDEHDDGQLTQFRRRLAAEMRAQTGHDFTIFQDREDIAWGENWSDVIDGALETVALLLVIITPGLFRSEASRTEISRFLQRERQLGRSDLILPVYYITAREIEAPPAQRTDPLAKLLSSRQYVDWRNMRFEPVTSPLALRTIAELASRMTSAFWRSPPLPGRPANPDGWQQQPTVGPGFQPTAGPGFQPTADPDPYAWLARNGPSGSGRSDLPGNGQEWIPLHQRSWKQPSQPFRRPTGSQAAPAQVPPVQPGPPPARQLTPGAGATPPPPSGNAVPTTRGPGDEPQVTHPSGGQGASPNGDSPTQPVALMRRTAEFWRSHRSTVLIGAALALVLAAAGTVYALSSPGTSAASPGAGAGGVGYSSAATLAAKLTATLTVPGGGTVDTVWISPDGKFIAAARTISPSDIYVWNTADPQGPPKTLTVPEMKVGTSAYPVMVENVAFSADDSSMTMTGYPASVTSAGKQSYILYQWNLAGGAPKTLWKVIQTPSNVSFSSDNSTAVESDKGSVGVQRLLPSPGKLSPLALPDGSKLTYTTSYFLDLHGTRMLYSPAENTYDVWDFAENKMINEWTSSGISYLSPDGTTAIVSYYGAKAQTLTPVPDLVNVDTMTKITPGDTRWQEQVVSSTPTIAYATYSTDGTVITTERAGGQTDLWSPATGKYLFTIADPSYRDDSSYSVVGPEGHEVVIFGDKAASGDHQFHQLDIWDTRLG